MLKNMDRVAQPDHVVSSRSNSVPSELSGIQIRLKQALDVACRRIGPVWDIRSFIATNAMQGFEDRPFHEAVESARKLFHADILMPTHFYQEQYQKGRIKQHDIAQALEDLYEVPGLKWSETYCCSETFLHNTHHVPPVIVPPDPIRTLVEVFDQKYQTTFGEFITGELAKWCAGYFDEGQAGWSMPGRHQRLYRAWRDLAVMESTCRLWGLTAFNEVVKQLPASPTRAIQEMLVALGVPPDNYDDYLSRHLTRLTGWSGYIKFRSAETESTPGNNSATDLTDLLAMSLTYEWALFCSIRAKFPVELSIWEVLHDLKKEVEDGEPSGDSKPEPRLIWQTAYENAFRRQLLSKIAPTGLITNSSKAERPVAQAVFCIDVRSEVFRRGLEAQGGPHTYQTLGFAGFFAFAIRHLDMECGHHTARCPALLKPQYNTTDLPTEQDQRRVAQLHSQKTFVSELTASLSRFKSSAVSGFFYVESLGMIFGATALMKTLLPEKFHSGLKRCKEWLTGRMATRPAVDVQDQSQQAAHKIGIPLEDQVTIAKTALTLMGLTSNFARIVLLCGHGSKTVNNPYAASLDCGACGGHEGQINARIAAAVFNKPEVRQRLAHMGIHIPDDTWFVAAQHNTTTDEVTIYDEDLLPSSHAEELWQMKQDLARAGQLAQEERAGRFGGEGAGSRQQPDGRHRSQDWSEVRPEWGLAGNAAFIVGHRDLTAGVNLEGRAFLHSYDHKADVNGKALETIMTAPMVVAEWINMQYYLSTVDNRRFGSGDKVTHNVVGKLGVMQGNQSDLLIGLPMQSVSDGERPVHEPLRLTVLIHAPRMRIQSIIERQPSVRRLVEGRWITLVALEPANDRYFQYQSAGKWEMLRV